MLNSTEGGSRGKSQVRPPPLGVDVSPRELFLQYLPVIERACEFACRRNHLSREEAEDFASVVKLKMIDDDYAVFRKFQGRSSMETYLCVVVNKAMLDYLNHLWGKWRPSKEAWRLGPLARLLEKLLARDGYSLDQACEILRTNHKVTQSRRELADLWARLPARVPRRIEGEEELKDKASADGGGFERLAEQERAARRDLAVAALERALAELPPADRLIVKMHRDGLKIATIARELGLEEKPLYRRIERIFKRLRETLESQGLRRQDIEELFGP